MSRSDWEVDAGGTYALCKKHDQEFNPLYHVCKGCFDEGEEALRIANETMMGGWNGYQKSVKKYLLENGLLDDDGKLIWEKVEEDKLPEPFTDIEIAQIHGEYPTEEQLKKIREFDISKHRDLLMEYIENHVWNMDYGNVFEGEDDGEETVALVTGGWSGNEEIIQAMKENYIFWSVHWLSSNRGGRHTFKKVGIKQ